jgi:hypothetical protein
MISTGKNGQVVEDYIKEELKHGRLIALPPGESIPGILISLFGVIPKTGQPNKWWLLADLSSPKGLRVNDSIDHSLTSLLAGNSTHFLVG